MSETSAAVGRRPVHAGSFYPAAPEALAGLVDRLLLEASRRLPPLHASAIRGVLVPHAGLHYSGPVAAAGWAAIGTARPDTVVLLGADHARRADGIAVWTGGTWHHPLGDMIVDEALAERIVALGLPFAADEGPHRDEHSVEVQLPFLARACPGTRVVPIVVNTELRTGAQEAGEALGRLLNRVSADGRFVVVASSDLAHYPPLALARAVDELMLEAICRLDAGELLAAEESACASSGGLLACGLCGREATRITIAAAREMGAVRGVLLEHATSVDYGGGDAASTVGYASVAFIG